MLTFLYVCYVLFFSKELLDFKPIRTNYKDESPEIKNNSKKIYYLFTKSQKSPNVAFFHKLCLTYLIMSGNYNISYEFLLFRLQIDILQEIFEDS